MSESALKRILVVVGVLVAAWLIVTLLRSPVGTGDGDPGPLADLVASLDPDRVQELRFVQPDDTIRLSRTDGVWSVNGHPADSARIARFWSDLAGARVTGPVARNPSNHPRLGVAADSATRMVARTAEGEEVTLLVGESGPSRPSAYVRLPDRDPVHVVHADLRGAAAREADAWRDRTVVRVDTSRVRRLVLSRPEGDVTLDRPDGLWVLDDGTPGDSAAVQGILGALAGLRATGFAPDTASLDAAGRTLVALDRAEDTLTVLSLAEMEPAGALLRARDDPTIYELTSYQVGRLFPEPDALRGGAGDGG